MDFEQSLVFDKFYRGRDECYSVQAQALDWQSPKQRGGPWNCVVGVTSQLGRGSVFSFDSPCNLTDRSQFFSFGRSQVSTTFAGIDRILIHLLFQDLPYFADQEVHLVCGL